MGPNKFPEFDSADVHIIITGSRQYHLHSDILKQISPVLRDLLSESTAAPLSRKAIKHGTTVRWRLVLVDNSDAINDGDDQRDDVHVLQAVPLNEEGKAPRASPTALDLENGLTVPAFVLAWDSVLGAFYNISIDFGYFEREALTDILTTAMSITHVAEYLQSIHVITRPIEATLLATGQILHQSIARSPLAWLNYAYRVKSRAIFREALIHSSGQYQMPSVRDNIGVLRPNVAEILHKKGTALRKGVQEAQSRLLSYYPTHMQRIKTVGRADKDSIGRASYANDIMSWIALVVLRHFFTQNLAGDETHHAADMGKELVDLVMAGEYLHKPGLTKFHELFPMSPKGEAVVENKLYDLKESVKQFFVTFMRNESQLDVRGFPVKHFTCTAVGVEDYPWQIGYATQQGEEDEEEEEDSDGEQEYAD